MKTEHRLKPVAKIAKSQERNAARVMGEMLQHAEEQQTQLDMLKNYRREYFHNYLEVGKAGLSVVQMRDYQVFLKRLDTAIVQQKQQVESCLQSCKQSQSDWQGRHNRKEMIDKVVEKRRLQSVQKQQSRQQRELDDRSAINFVSKL